jgi:tetratricopeptide (TPR) repeat protein
MNEQLRHRLKPVLSKRAGLALALWGEAGVGKSYTVQKLLRELPCQCLGLHATTPLSALAQRLPKTKKLALWAQQTLERSEKNEYVESPSLLDAIIAALAHVAPFVLHLEDMHEVEGERLAFFQRLALGVQRSKGVALFVTSRTEPSKHFTAVRLTGLSRTEADALLEKELGATLPHEALEWIYSKASGNPLYTLEYLRFLTRQGNLWNDGRVWHWRKPESNVMPATVEALIELTLSKVSQDERLETLLQGKSLLPLDAGSDLLEAVTNLSSHELATAHEQLSRQGVFINDTFAHPLYRELTLHHLPKTKRQAFAKKALEFSRADPVQAVDFLEDANLKPDDALTLLRKAVERARENKNDLQTGKFLAKMLEYLPGEQQAEVALEAATCLKYVAVSEATRLAALAASLSEKIAPRATLLQAELLAIQGHLGAAEALWQTFEPSQSQADYLAGVVRLRGVAHHYSGVAEVLENYPECFTEPDAATTQWLARSLAQFGQAEKAQALIAKAKPLTDDDKVLLLKAASDVAYAKADFAEMETLESHIYSYAKKAGNLRVMDQALFNRALALEDLGRYEERKASLEEAMRVCQELGDVTALMIAQRAYGSVLVDLGEYDRAEEYLQGARQYLEGIEFYTYLLDCETTLSQFYRESGRSYGNVLSLKHARAAVACAKQINNPANIADALCTLALAHLENAQLSEAEEHLHVASETLKTLDVQQAQLGLQITKAYLCKAKGQRDAAILLFQAALEEARERGALLEQERLGLELDHLTGNKERARERLEWFEKRGLKHGVHLVKKLFPELSTQSVPTPALEEPLLRLHVLGTMQLFMGGTGEDVRGRKRRELLALLLEARLAGRSEVGKLELLDALYSNEDELKASTNLRELVYVLREHLGAHVISTTATGYALGNLASDAEQFLRTGNTLLWRGVYLEGVEVELRESVAEPLYWLLFGKGQELLKTDPKEAVRVAKVLLEYDPYNQDYLRLCLQAFRASNNHKSLTRLYTDAKERFIDIGENLPEQWQAFIAS